MEGVFLRITAEWDDFTVTPEDRIASDDKAVVRGRYRGVYKQNGARVDAQFVHAWKLRGGEIVEFQQYTDTAQFRDAVTKPHSAGA